MSTYFTSEDSSILGALIITCVLLAPKCLILCPDHESWTELQFCIFNLRWAFPPWCSTIVSNPGCLSFCSSLPSPSHTQNSFLYPISLPLSITFILLGTESSDHLFSRVSKFPQAFLFQSVLTARTRVRPSSPCTWIAAIASKLSHRLLLRPTSSLNATHIISLP